MNLRLDQERKQVIQEMAVEREHHQRLVKDHGRLQQRMENLLEERNAKSMPSLAISSTVEGHCDQLSLVPYDKCRQVSMTHRHLALCSVIGNVLTQLIGSRIVSWAIFLLNPTASQTPFGIKMDFKLRFRFNSG